MDFGSIWYPSSAAVYLTHFDPKLSHKLLAQVFVVGLGRTKFFLLFKGIKIKETIKNDGGDRTESDSDSDNREPVAGSRPIADPSDLYTVSHEDVCPKYLECWGDSSFLLDPSFSDCLLVAFNAPTRPVLASSFDEIDSPAAAGSLQEAPRGHVGDEIRVLGADHPPFQYYPGAPALDSKVDWEFKLHDGKEQWVRKCYMCNRDRPKAQKTAMKCITEGCSEARKKVEAPFKEAAAVRKAQRDAAGGGGSAASGGGRLRPKKNKQQEWTDTEKEKLYEEMTRLTDNPAFVKGLARNEYRDTLVCQVHNRNPDMGKQLRLLFNKSDEGTATAVDVNAYNAILVSCGIDQRRRSQIRNESEKVVNRLVSRIGRKLRFEQAYHEAEPWGRNRLMLDREWVTGDYFQKPEFTKVPTKNPDLFEAQDEYRLERMAEWRSSNFRLDDAFPGVTRAEKIFLNRALARTILGSDGENSIPGGTPRYCPWTIDEDEFSEGPLMNPWYVQWAVLEDEKYDKLATKVGFLDNPKGEIEKLRLERNRRRHKNKLWDRFSNKPIAAREDMWNRSDLHLNCDYKKPAESGSASGSASADQHTDLRSQYIAESILVDLVMEVVQLCDEGHYSVPTTFKARLENQKTINEKRKDDREEYYAQSTNDAMDTEMTKVGPWMPKMGPWFRVDDSFDVPSMDTKDRQNLRARQYALATKEAEEHEIGARCFDNLAELDMPGDNEIWFPELIRTRCSDDPDDPAKWSHHLSDMREFDENDQLYARRWPYPAGNRDYEISMKEGDTDDEEEDMDVDIEISEDMDDEEIERRRKELERRRKVIESRKRRLVWGFIENIGFHLMEDNNIMGHICSDKEVFTRDEDDDEVLDHLRCQRDTGGEQVTDMEQILRQMEEEEAMEESEKLPQNEVTPTPEEFLEWLQKPKRKKQTPKKRILPDVTPAP